MMKIKMLTLLKYLTMMVMALSLTFFTNCSDEDDVDDPNQIVDGTGDELQNILLTLEGLGGYDTLIMLLNTYPYDANGSLLSTALGNDGSYTLFAPNNDAFAALYLTVGVTAATEVSPAVLASLLTYHGHAGLVQEIIPGDSILTLNGEYIYVNADGTL